MEDISFVISVNLLKIIIMDARFFSYASNFRDMDNIGVDPRTGQFIVNVPLENLIGNNLLGPEFLLKLSYNPLDTHNRGFGSGFSLGCTKYNKLTGFLELSNGETHYVYPHTFEVSNNPSHNFHFKYNNKNHKEEYIVYWNDGRIETLSTTGEKNSYVTTNIKAPIENHFLELEWDWEGLVPLLKRIKDKYRTLCEINYGGITVIISVWPDTSEAYKIECELNADGTYLTRISYLTSDNSSRTWFFTYDHVEGRDLELIAGITHPTGMIELVDYCPASEGLRFPATSGMKNLSVVTHHTRDPKNRQPVTDIDYTYGDRNFLGYGESSFGDWSPGSDYIYKKLTDYVYSCTKKHTIDRKNTFIEHEYNNYHLLIKETVTTDDMTYQTDFTYYAEKDTFIDEQKPQFQFVKEKKERRLIAGETVHQQITNTEFDEYGNLLREETPIIEGEKKGQITLRTWYAAKGEDGCPAEPNGFVRFMKEQTTIPMETNFNTPEMRTCYTYSTLKNSENVVLVHSYVYNAEVLLGEQFFYYDENNLSSQYGSITRINDVKYERGESFHSYNSQLDITISVDGNLLGYQTLKTGHDDIRLGSYYSRSVLSGRVLRRTDEQNVNTDYRYDRLGRLLIRTDAAGSEYSNSVKWSYAREGASSVVTITDEAGNKVRSYFDGADELIRQQKCNGDSLDKWYDTFIAASQPGNTDLTLSGPVCGTEAAGCEEPATGKIVTIADKRSGRPLKISRIDGSDNEVSACHYQWDGLGQLRMETDELNNVTQFTYDAYGRLLKRILPDDTEINYTYAPHLTGQLIASVRVIGLDRNGEKKDWCLGTQDFDSLGRLIWKKTGGRNTRYIYVGASPVPLRIMLPAEKSVTYTYIPQLGNAVSHVFTNNISQYLDYDRLKGKVTEAGEDKIRQQNFWSLSGRLDKQLITINDDDNNSSYEWSQTGELNKFSDMTYAETLYKRDSSGHIVEINDEYLIANLEYDDKGRVIKRVVKDKSTLTALTTILTYDDFDREISRFVTDIFENTFIIIQTWHKNGLLASRKVIQDDVTINHQSYTYDKRKRLTTYIVEGKVLPTDAYGNEIVMQNFTYDALDNIVQVITHMPYDLKDIATYNYDNGADPTQLTSVHHTNDLYPSSYELTYDIKGNLLVDDHGNELIYDTLGRLRQCKPSHPGLSSVEYKYDAFNRLLATDSKSIKEKHTFCYCGDTLVNESIKADSVIMKKRFIRFQNTCLAVHDGINNLILTETDQNGNIILSYNRNTSVDHKMTFYCWAPYGNSTFNYLPVFNGGWVDVNTGLYHMGNGYRAFNPRLMRFNRPDDFSPFDGGGINPYAYCEGDPINNIDPSGHLSIGAISNIVISSISLAAVVTGMGLAVIAAGGIMAALSATSGGMLVYSGFCAISDIAAILSGALEDTAPQTSSVLGYLSLGMGAVTLAGSVKTLIKKPRVLRNSQELYNNIYTKPVSFGGNMRNIDFATDGLYTFTDTYKGANRLNIVAHGQMVDQASRLVVGTSNKLRWMDVDELAFLLRNRYNLDNYANLRTLSCYSGAGGEMSFGARLSNATGKPVKSYINRMTGNYEVNRLGQLVKDAETRGVYEEFLANFPLKRSFVVYKKNPFGLININHWTWSYNPVIFRPQIP